MAPYVKKNKQAEIPEGDAEKSALSTITNAELNRKFNVMRSRFDDLERRFEELKTLVMSKPVDATKGFQAQINRTELGEEQPVREDTRMKMALEDKIISMRNAIKILPPNYVKDGRHSKENVSAICGFVVSDEMMDEAYKDFSHDL